MVGAEQQKRKITKEMFPDPEMGHKKKKKGHGRRNLNQKCKISGEKCKCIQILAHARPLQICCCNRR